MSRFVAAGGLVLALLVVAQPVVGIVVVAGVLVLLATRRAPGGPNGFFLSGLAVLLFGYAFLGRGFAYLGYPPVYIGEVFLGLGVVLVVLGGGVGPALRVPLAGLLVLFAAWGAIRTVPYLSVHGFDALRDAVVWAYSAFALLVAASLVRKDDFSGVERALRFFYSALVLWIPVAVLLRVTDAPGIPTVPGSGVPLVDMKAGDAGVHLAGAAAFLALGLSRRRDETGGTFAGPGTWLLWGAWCVGFVLVASQSRGGMLAAASGLVLVMVLRPFSGWWKLLLTAALLLSAALFVLPEEVDIGRTRRVSGRQIIANLQSVVGRPSPEYLQGTVQWRLRWWGDIVDYTLGGEYFWVGKGFGVNLARDDGYVVDPDDPRPLRSPHNGLMTILARSGVPGAALWLLLQAAFAWGLWRAYRRAGARGEEQWARLDLWILAYWTAFMVNGAFDVFLEGPQGGIWYWSVFGAGMAALELQRREAAFDGAPSPHPAVVAARGPSWSRSTAHRLYARGPIAPR